jgi:hypothetical protein
VGTLVFVGLSLAACHRGALKGDRGASDAGTDADGAEAGSPGPSVSPDAAPDAPPVSTDGGVDGEVAGSDAGLDGADPNRDFDQLLRNLNDVFDGRLSACVGTPRALFAPDDLTDIPASSLSGSVRLGLIKVDPEATRRCLDALMTASCDGIVDISLQGPLGPGNPALPECADVLAGQVAPGGSCRENEDCQSSEQYACVGNRTCGAVCTPRILRAAGDSCYDATDRCPDGTFCIYGPDGYQACIRPTAEGGPCGAHGTCGSGLLCVPSDATSTDGTCRPLALGSPCTGNGDCAYAYVCAGAGPNHPGTCQVGKSVGAPCTPDLQGAPTDCAWNTSCLDLDGNGPRCVAGAPLYGRCGAQIGPYPGSLPCLEGYCADDPASDPSVGTWGTCLPTKPAGASCDGSYGECTPPNECLTRFGGWVCGLPDAPVPVGTRCMLNDGCGAGEYCAVPAGFDPALDPLFLGTCAPLIPVGGSCRRGLDRCDGFATCMNGVCQRC